jgi:hypothetical protein
VIEAAPPPIAEVPPPAAVPPAGTAPIALPPAQSAAPPAAQDEGGSSWGWLLLVGGALAVGALALLLLRRRGRDDEFASDAYEAPAVHHEPVVHHPEPVHAVAAAAPLAAAAAPERGNAALDLIVEPVRAGVRGTDAVVEFELKLGNRGDAPARDVHVSAWLLAAGGSETDMERVLIDRPDEADVPAIAPGTAERLAAALRLPTGQLSGDSVLPVVVAEARYRHPDGSESTTTARYAVGVPDGEELAHFAIDNPSGLHESVVARELGEAERT